MGKTVARNASIYLEDSSGASQSFSGLTNSIQFTQTAEAPDVTSFGSDVVERLSNGLKDWEITGGAFFSTGANEVDAVLSGILGGSTLVKFGPTGSSSGCIMYSASAVLTEYSMDFSVAEAATVTYTVVQRSGSMTRGTW